VADPRGPFVIPAYAGIHVNYFTRLLHRVADPGLVTFPARPGKVTKRRPPLMRRACAFLALLNEFGVCGTRSKNEKTHMGCELRHVLDHNTELICVTQRLKRGPANGQRRNWRQRVVRWIEKTIPASSPVLTFTALCAVGTRWESPSSRRQGREFGCCLSARPFNVFSHFEREFNGRRPCRAAQEIPGGDDSFGRPFLWLLFFWPRKRK